MASPKRGEVWRVDFNPIIGHEQGEIRPALVLSVDEMNDSAERSIVLPLTKNTNPFPTKILVEPPEGGLRKRSCILCDQIRSVSHERFSAKTGTVSNDTLFEVERILKLVLGFV